MPPESPSKKVIIVCTWDWYYYSHRRSIAQMFLDTGHEVIVVTRDFGLKSQIEADGVRVIDIPFSRSSLNPFRELGIIRRLRKIYKSERPDIVYHVAFKPVLYGSLAAVRLFGKSIPKRINAIAGLGQLFLGKTLKIRFLRCFVLWMLRCLFRNRRNRMIAQNQSDFDKLKQRLRLQEDQITLIKGVGIDLNEFQTQPKKTEGPPVVTLASRLIREKGVYELVEASRILQTRGVPCRFWLVGEPDSDSPEQITVEELQKWEAEGWIEWKGFSDTIDQVYVESDVAVLPSYSEGLPKSLLEAAACGLPIVSTNNSGCKEVVDEGKNGFLVPVRDPVALADALERLVLDPELRQRMGARSREKAENEFGVEKIVNQVRTFCGL